MQRDSQWAGRVVRNCIVDRDAEVFGPAVRYRNPFRAMHGRSMAGNPWTDDDHARRTGRPCVRMMAWKLPNAVPRTMIKAQARIMEVAEGREQSFPTSVSEGSTGGHEAHACLSGAPKWENILH
jgi:hypothetical protein